VGLTPLETAVKGFEELPQAIDMVFAGKNVGNLVRKMAR
jgi:NADPH-dependent curcumin reductase CurA